MLALQRLGADVEVTAAAWRAAAAWGPAVATPERVERVLAGHRQLLAIAEGGRAMSATGR